MNGKKIFFRLTAGLLLLVVLGGVLSAAGWLWSFRLAPGDVPKTAELSPAADVYPGVTVTAAVSMQLPLSWDLSDVQFSSAPPVVMTHPPEISLQKYEWRHKVVRVQVQFTALRPGETKPGTLSFTLRRRFSRPVDDRHGSAMVPAFMVVEKILPPDGVKLELADELPPPRPPFFRRYRFWGILGGAAALLLLFFWWRSRARQKGQRVVPPWEKALTELHALQFLFEQKRVAAETGLVRLTDLVRRYLEERYGLPATTETTPEFLNSLDRGRGERLLPEEQKPFLREFLQAADLVRFARADADRNMVDRAIAQAENLVESTIPAAENGSTRER